MSINSVVADMSLAKKLGAGFSVVVAIMIGIVVISVVRINGAASVSTRISDLRVPTAMAGLEMSAGFNKSLAALRGWMLLGNEAFVKQRADAWELEIEPALAAMQDLSKNWTSQKNLELLRELEEIIPEFKGIQAEIEAIAQTDDNVPSLKLLLSEAAPQAQIIVSSITRMIDLEAAQPATPERKALLGMMADVRGSMGLALASIRAYLLAGDEKFLTDYEGYWATNETRFADLLDNAGLLTREQRSAFDELRAARDVFAPLPPRMLASRASAEWNVGNSMLATQAAPLANRLNELLRELSASQRELLSGDAGLIKQTISNLINLSWSMLGAGLVLAVLSALAITRYLVKQIGSAVQVAERIAKGDLSGDIQVNGKDETGRLLGAMASMQTNLSVVIEKEVQSLVDSANNGNLEGRIDTREKTGFYRTLSKSINDLMEVNGRFLKDTAAVVSALANGDLKTAAGGTNYKGSFAVVQEGISQMRQKLSDIIGSDIQSIINAANKGDLSRRIDLQDKKGFYLDLSSGINSLVEINEAIINDVIHVSSALSSGNLGVTIERDYQGSFGQLKQNIETLQNKLRLVIEKDIQSIVAAAANGDLKQRIDLSDKLGFYRDLSASINEMVDTSDRIISDASRVLGAMATGDLTKSISNNYKGTFGQLKNDINASVDKLAATVVRIQQAASRVEVGAAEISAGSTSLSVRTEEQAASLEETSASLEELTTTVKMTAQNSAEASKLSLESNTNAVNGGKVVEKAIAAMHEIDSSSQQIANIIGVINDIAFQTNLLALNAAVEAARAGEQGRGFSVVAQEVRSLAGRCATAAKEIKDIIQGSHARVNEGTALVAQSGTVLKDIISSAKKVSDIIAEISNANEEQSQGLGEINKAVVQLDETTQQNAALVEETASSSESLNAQAQELNTLVSFFKVDGGVVTGSGQDGVRRKLRAVG